MPTKYTEDDVDGWYRDAGLVPLTPYQGMSKQRDATCTSCGTLRRVTPKIARDPNGIHCRWCDGWRREPAAAQTYRWAAATWRTIEGPSVAAEKIELTGLVPLTPFGDEFTPVGCLCPRCGETLVVIPGRVDARRPEWSGCSRCLHSENLALADDAEAVYARAGLRLLEKVRSRFSPKDCECLRCGATRRVTYDAAAKGTYRACWSCLFGIDPNEPHRVYLFRFSELGVLKVGITHNRHDGRLLDHQVQGGELLQSAVVPDRATALAVESWVLATKRPWLRIAVGPADFPQGGWTEAWLEADAPDVDLAAVCALVSTAMGPA